MITWIAAGAWLAFLTWLEVRKLRRERRDEEVRRAYLLHLATVASRAGCRCDHLAVRGDCEGLRYWRDVSAGAAARTRSEPSRSAPDADTRDKG